MSLNFNSVVIDYNIVHTDDKKGKCVQYNSIKSGISPKEFVKANNIKSNNYVWLRRNEPDNGTYIKCSKSDKLSILFIKESWVNKNIPDPQLVKPVLEVAIKPLSPQLPITKFYSPPQVNDVEPVIVNVTKQENVSVVQPEFSEKMVPEPITFYEGTGEEIRKGLFFNASELQKFNPEFFYGLKDKTNVREIVKIKNIPASDVAYGSLIKNKGWCIRSVNVNQAKLFLSKEWVDTYFWKRNELNPEQITVMTQYEYAPPKLYLSYDMIFTLISYLDIIDMNL